MSLGARKESVLVLAERYDIDDTVNAEVSSAYENAVIVLFGDQHIKVTVEPDSNALIAFADCFVEHLQQAIAAAIPSVPVAA